MQPSNLSLGESVKKKVEVPVIPLSIGLDMNRVMNQWRTDSDTLRWLISTQKNILFHLRQSDLSLGHKTKHWGGE